MRDNLSLSSKSNLKFYVLNYNVFLANLVLDNEKDTLCINTLGTDNFNLYNDDFEDYIYLKQVQLRGGLNSIALKNNKKIYYLHNEDNLDLLIKRTDGKLHIYYDVEYFNILSTKDGYSFHIDTDYDLNEYEILEVKFNNKEIKKYTLDTTLKTIQILDVTYKNRNYLNNLQIVIGKKYKDVNNISIFFEYSLHNILNKTNFTEDIESKYKNITNIVKEISINKHIDSINKYEKVKNRALHTKSKYNNTEISIEIYNKFLRYIEDRRYGENKYGDDYYSVDINDIVNTFQKSGRFRFLIYDDLLGDVYIINNCRTREDFNFRFEEINHTLFTVNGDKEKRFRLLKDISGYLFYTSCNQGGN